MRRIAWLVIATVALTLGGCAYVAASGSVIVHDDIGAVTNAAIADGSGGRTRALWRLPGGIFVGMPDSDGEVKVRCRDGSVAQAGYVTPGLHTSVRVVGSAPCRVTEEL